MAVDFNIEIRKKQLDSLDQFLASSKSEITSILNSLGWSEEKIQNDQRLFATCPYNTGHKVPAEKIVDHSSKCKLTSAGYDLQEEFMSDPVVFLEDTNIRIDMNKKIEILCQAFTIKPDFKAAWNGKDPDPLTYSRLFSTFSTDERLVLYDYCIANTRRPPELPEFDTSVMAKQKSRSSFTKEALMSFQRDIKRRSVKYKPIHTNHKSYKDILREIIDSQMQQYNDWLEGAKRYNKSDHTNSDVSFEFGEESESQDKSQEYTERPFSSVSKFSNSSGGSQVTKHSKFLKTSHTDSQFQLFDNETTRSNEYHSHYKNHNSKSSYKHLDEDSQESNSFSKVSSVDMDSSCENYEGLPKTHSRESSIYSSKKYRQRTSSYTENRRHKSRSDRRWKERDHSSGSSKHSSRSHRSKEDRYNKRTSRDKNRRH